MNKREFLKTGLVGFVGLVSLPSLAGKKSFANGTFHKFVLPDLPYAYDALEPYISTETLRTHHDSIHADYTRKFNAILQEQWITIGSAREVFKNASEYNAKLVDYGGGYFNHRIFWPMLAPSNRGTPSDRLMKAINSSFGSLSQFKESFSRKAKNTSNSGWSWLISRKNQLKITATSGQNNPFMNTIPEDDRGFPLLCLDLWDHAGGSKYQNRRDEYVDAFWNIVNWNTVNKRFERANSR